MTRKEQNKILNDKIESNINQYKVDRLNAEISAFSSGDLNRYKFLTRKDLKYKPNALDKARFELSPLGQTFSTGLNKTAQRYQEEGVIKLLKDIRDGLVGGIVPREPIGPGLSRPDDNNDDNNDDNMPDLETEEEAERIAITSALIKFKNNIEVETNNLDKIFINKKNELNNKLKENNDKIIKKEKEYNKILLKYSQLNRELNKTKDKLNKTKEKLNKAKDNINEKTKYINELKEIEKK